MYTPCHACPLPCMPSAMHAPCHAFPPATHAPPAMHVPCHAPPMHASPVDRILDTHFWKYYLAPTSLRAVKILPCLKLRFRAVKIKGAVYVNEALGYWCDMSNVFCNYGRPPILYGLINWSLNCGSSVFLKRLFRFCMTVSLKSS